MPEPDKRLFTPGPLNTSASVKHAMLRDLGSRDDEFVRVVREIRHQLLALAGVSKEAGYEAIPIQGSGTFGIEATLSSVVPQDGRLLVPVNGAYGERMLAIAERHGIATVPLRVGENSVHDPAEVGEALEADAAITHIAIVHCETTSGILNPLEPIAGLAARHGKSLIVDAMSSFGAIPLPVGKLEIDFLISSANKCLEGVPGFSFVIARREALLASRGHARTVSLDLLSQWEGLESNGQFRFTPPTHALLAFHQALLELDREGGVMGRLERYSRNHECLLDGMRKLGFLEYVPRELQSPVITTFHYPEDPAFAFETFYRLLAEKGMVIYPGKLTHHDCFRIGTIGQLFEGDIRSLLDAIEATLKEMGVRLPPGN